MTMIKRGLWLYAGNKMVGVRDFNESWFDQTEKWLLKFREVDHVFNPASADRDAGLTLSGSDGTVGSITGGPSVRRTRLHADWNWIGRFSDGMVAGPDWRDSPGTISEVACHQALFLPVWEEATVRKVGKSIFTAAMIDGQNVFTIPRLLDLNTCDSGLTCDC